MQDPLAVSLVSLNRRFGPAAVVCMADQDNGQVEAIPTGSALLDEALGVGGVPRGLVTEIYGPPGAGKTSLVLSIAAQAQRAGETVAFIDTEHTLVWEYALQLGVVAERFVIAQPDSAEEALEVCLGLVQSGRVAVVIIDSIAGLVPRAELQGEVGDSHAGLLAATMGRGLRKLAGPLKGTGTALVVTNQFRYKIGVMFGNPETTPGGNALKYTASVRLDIRAVQTIKFQGEVLGNRVRVIVKKSRVGFPYRQAEFGLVFGLGLVDDIEELLDARRAERRA